jgi:hypothetical protein
LIGIGEAKMFLNGQIVQDWIDIRNMKPIGPFALETGNLYGISIYYRNTDVNSGIALLHQNERGFFSPIDENCLYRPFNRSEFTTDHDVDLEVRAVDWTGRTSPFNRTAGYLDDSAPVIDISSIQPWYNTDEIDLNLSITDGDPTASSGIEPDSIAFRTREKNGTWEPWENIPLETEEGPLPDIISVNVHLDLNRNWKGYIQFTASDRLGNEGSSPQVFLGIDMKAPDIENVGPRDGSQLELEKANVTFRFTDIGGSGVDSSSIRYRSKVENSKWTEWINPSTMIIDDAYLAWVDGITSSGYTSFQFKGSDYVGNERLSEIVNYDMLEPVINYPPRPVIKEPENGSVHQIGKYIVFDAFGTWDDGLGGFPEVRFTWVSSIDGHIGSGNRIKALLSEGEHRIHLYADDGSPGHNITTWIIINVTKGSSDDGDTGIDPHVEEKKDSIWIELILLSIVSAFILTGIIVALAYNRSRRIEETRLEITEKVNEDPPDIDEVFYDR